MSGALAGQIRSALSASRDDAERILQAAESRATELSGMAASTDRALAQARIERLESLRAEIDHHHERIVLAYVAIAEAMAAAAEQLAAAARDADFENPAWQERIRGTLELKLTETREVTVRISRDRMPGAGAP